MRFSLVIFAVLSVSTAAISVVADQTGDSNKEFFNGKDLDGFEGVMKFWSVKDGAIVGSTPEDLTYNTFLCSKKKFKDFELKFKVRLTGNSANSGVQIRSEIMDKQKFVVKGPQCDMGQQYWGSLYGEHFPDSKGGMMMAAQAAAVKKAVKTNDFNDYEIKC